MNRQEKIESIRNWLKSCKQEVMLGKKLFPDTFDVRLSMNLMTI